VRTGRLTAWFGAAVVVTAALASADDAATRFYETRLARTQKAAAARLWDAAERARRDSLFRFARDEALLVLEFDPDHAAARAFLGYVRRPEGWEMDLGASGRLPTENKAMGATKLADAETAWRTKVAARAVLDVAALYSGLGDECAAKGFRTEAESAYRRALEFDADNEGARRGLGYVQFVRGLWIEKERASAFESARVAQPVAETSRWDEICGVTFNKARSEHFRVESPFPPDAIAKYLESCERVYAIYMAEFGVDRATKVLAQAPVFCVLSDDVQWNRWIDRVPRGNPGFWRGLACHWARDRWACAVRNFQEFTDVERRDRVAHQTGHMLNLAFCEMPDGFWLDEALAHRYAVLAQDRTASYCVAPRKEDYGRAGEKLVWTDQGQWKDLLKQQAMAKDDLALRAIVSKSAYDLPLAASVKAWSVVDFLIRRDRAAFVALVRGCKAENDRVAALETRYGKDVETLDELWRKWVIETY
jgi:tetratricopeptide (TPR) repeat protein